MATFEFQAPDGRLFEAEASDAATAVAAFKKLLGQQGAKTTDASTPYTQMRPIRRAPDAPKSAQPSPDELVRLIANGATCGLADKVAGAMDYATGSAPSYTEGVNAERARTQAVRDRYPVGSTVAEIGGGVLSGAGLVKSGLTLAGRVGPRLLPRVAGYAAEGSGYGAAHGAGNTFSENPREYVKNAAHGAGWGALIGGALPVAGSALGGIYRAGSAFFGPRVGEAGRGASSLLRAAALADEQGLKNLSALGPEGMIPDAGPAMLGLAQGAATGTGKGRSDLVNTLRDRESRTAERLMQSLDTNLGPAPIPSRIEAGLNADRAYVAQEYDPALRGARAVNTRNLANDLETSTVNLRGPAQSAVSDVRRMLDIHGVPGTLDPNPGTLLQTRRAIDGMISKETNPTVIQELTAVRQKVDAELTRAVPGIKNVDAQIEELSRQSDGLVRGGQVLDSGKTAIRPTELVDELAQGANPKGTMVGPSGTPLRIRQGLRADIDRRVGTNINDLNELEKTFATPNDWNYQKIGAVFGEGARDRVAADIRSNRLFRNTKQAIVDNSQTAQRTAAARAMDGAAGGNVPQDLTATSLGLRAANKILKALSGQSNATTKDEIGMLLAKRGVEADTLARLLLSSAQRTNANASTLADLVSSPRWIPAYSPEVGRR